jgi:hypothetical protein
MVVDPRSRSQVRRPVNVRVLIIALVGASTALTGAMGTARALADPPSMPAGLSRSALQPGPPPARAEWPPLAEQFARDNVKPGSNLEKLIRANQDFQLLRADEASDRNPLPPWLRVLWRKSHPGDRYSAADPSGGYPLVLREVHEWMLSHQDLRPAQPDSPRAPEKVASESAEQRISGPQQGPRSESDIRVNFFDPAKIVAASNNITASGLQAMFYSLDGGVSWGQTSLPRFGPDVFHSDPAVEWTSDGTAWSSTIGIAFSGVYYLNLRMRAYRSTDHGQTWSFDDTFSGNELSADKELLWADHSASSPYKDNLYAIWHNSRIVLINRRTGPGGSWQHPVEVSGGETIGTGIGADITTNGAGDVFGFWPDTGSQRIFFVKSTDGGATFSAARAIAGTFMSFVVGVPSDDYRGVLIYVSAAAFKDANKNNIYATWTDLSGEGGCIATYDAPYGAITSTCKTRIWFMRSLDGGATWSSPTMINNLATPDDQFFQRLIVDPTSGRLGIVYYDTIKDAGRLTTQVFYQSSTDDGTTWSNPFQVTTASSDETPVGLGADYNQYGDYIGFSGFNGSFHPSWTDRRGGKFEEIWSSAIADSPAGCTPPSAPAGLAVAASSASGVSLSWTDVPGTTYQVWRSTASGGPYSLIGTTPTTSFFDSKLTCGAAYYYVVRAAWNGCESAVSNEVSTAGRVATVLYSNDFESGSGLSDWKTGTFNGGTAADWVGIQTCAAHSGNNVFRFGGATCSGTYGANDYSFAQPNGSSGIPIPARTTDTQVSFWHRRDFEPSLAGGTLAFSPSFAYYYGYLSVPPEAIVAGATYDGTLNSSCPATPNGLRVFTGTQSSFVNSVVDVDAACRAYFNASCAGSNLSFAFAAVTGCAPAKQGWFLDDVTVSTCAPAPAPPLGFYTVPPCRLIDTRNSPGPLGGPALKPGELRAASLSGTCLVPPAAKALSVNVTVVQPAAGGEVAVFAADQPVTPTAVVRFSAGQVRANNAILAVSNDGRGGILINNRAGSPLDVVLDVNGYFQ